MTVLATISAMLFLYGLVITGCFAFYLRRYDKLAENYSSVAMDMVETFKEVSDATSELIGAIDDSCTLTKDNKQEIINKLGELEHRMTDTIHRNSSLMSSLLQRNDVHIFNTNSESGNVSQGVNAKQDIKE